MRDTYFSVEPLELCDDLKNLKHKITKRIAQIEISECELKVELVKLYEKKQRFYVAKRALERVLSDNDCVARHFDHTREGTTSSIPTLPLKP